MSLTQTATGWTIFIRKSNLWDHLQLADTDYSIGMVEIAKFAGFNSQQLAAFGMRLILSFDVKI